MANSKMLQKWTPAAPIPNKDNIISSDARANNEKGFVPSFENEGRPTMSYLLNNEYMRRWFDERSLYEKEVYTKKVMMSKDSKVTRRYVQRDMIPRKRVKRLPIIKLKMFQNIPARTDNHQKETKPNEE